MEHKEMQIQTFRLSDALEHGLLYIWTGRQKSPCTIEGIHKNGYKSEISQSNSSKLSGYKLLTSGRHIN